MKEYLFLGLLQGIFEWLPISSEGIVSLFSSFLKMPNPIDLALYLHLGTLFSAIIYFYHDWKKIIFLKDKKTFNFLLKTTLVSLLVGGFFYFLIKDFSFGGSFLILMGAGLFLTGFFHKKSFSFKIDFEKLAFLVGFLQGLSVIPGVSRSGATIFGLSLSSLPPKQILKLSYLLSVPVVLFGSIFLSLKNPFFFSKEVIFSSLVAFLTGLLSLKFLLKVASKLNFSKFCFIFGLLCLLGGLIEFLK